MAFRLQIVTPRQPVVDAEVDSVLVPGSEGEFGALPEHERFLAPLRPGIVEYTAGGVTHRIAISGGFAEVSGDHLTLLARTAELADQIDRARAESARDRTDQELRDADAHDVEHVAELEAAAGRAAARLRTLG